MSTRPRAARDERGGVAIIVAVAALAMFAFAALVVDLGHARDMRRQSQNASDAAALAAANSVYTTSARVSIPAAVAAAQDYAEDNLGVPLTAWSSCADPGRLVVPPGSTQCISFAPNLTRPTEIRVKMPDVGIPTPFGSLLGVSEINVSSIAQAVVSPGRRASCGLCVIGPGVHNLENGDIHVEDAGVHFNGDVYPKVNGMINVTRGSTTVEGTAMTGRYSPTAVVGSPRLDDPLTLVTLPDATGLTAKSDPCTQGPGIYGARTISSMTCRLSPGLYVIAGSGLTKWLTEGSSATTRLEGHGVTLFFTCGTSTAPRPCNTGEQGALLDGGGSGTVEIKAPTTGPWAGMAIIYDRNNTSMLRLRGNGMGSTTGTIYQASGGLYIAGTACSNTIDSLIVVSDLDMDGDSSCLKATYTTSTNVLLPGGPLYLSR